MAEQVRQVDVAIIGAGTAGMYAMREAKRAGRSFVLIEQGPLGTTCARLGCMPSKVALHTAALWAERQTLAAAGATGLAGRMDLAQAWAHLRTQRDSFSNPVAARTEAAAGTQLLRGQARFLTPTVLEVRGNDTTWRVEAAAVVIATGSHPVRPEWLAPFADRVVTTDELFELADLPSRMGVLGLGAIGLEMGLALARLGVTVVGADVASTLGGLRDPQVASRAAELVGREMTLWLGDKVVVEAMPQARGLRMHGGGRSETVDMLLVAMGRRPNVAGLGLAEAGFALDAHGVPRFDAATMQVGDWPVFIAGDVNADRPLVHEAADEGAIAGYNAARGLRQGFMRKAPLAIAFTDPDIAVVGARYETLDPAQIIIGSVGGERNGRSRILGGAGGLLQVYADAGSGRLLGASLVAKGGEHLAQLLAWAIQRGETAQSLLQMPFYHPTVEEMLQTALADIAHHFQTDTDVPQGLVPRPA